jgi:hypothetical protein
MMMLAGVPVPDRLVLTIAGNLRQAGLDATAGRLENGYDTETKVLALSIAERDDILQVLVDCPDGLGELRAVLLQERVWRVREGLA